MWRNYIRFKQMFLFPLENLAHKGLKITMPESPAGCGTFPPEHLKPCHVLAWQTFLTRKRHLLCIQLVNHTDPGYLHWHFANHYKKFWWKQSRRRWNGGILDSPRCLSVRLSIRPFVDKVSFWLNSFHTWHLPFWGESLDPYTFSCS